MERGGGSTPLTWGLIGLSLLGYIAEGLCGGDWGTIGGKTLVACGGLYGPALFEGGEWWRLLSAMFLHGGIEHLALNMISLYIVGRIMEVYFPPLDYLLIYFLSGIGGFLLSLALHPDTVIIGASGAIFGIFGALGGFVLFHRERLGSHYHTFLKEFGIILGLNLVFDLAVPGIDMSAHIGGLLLGGIGGYLASGHRRLFYLFVAGVSLGILAGAFWLQKHFALSSIPYF
ncbi:rhomboid family intramembrane serine protease [Nitratifractor sp.]|uniref:rhomboid family intramembrane serine protease n=1 Tax=Nitratifractor sp. TaxID=2268144 RepID=UPI0025E458A4|nr:rhomboid family intramembrane serine protease [Nitratifractor sp.]